MIGRLLAVLWLIFELQFGKDPHDTGYDPYA